MDTVSVEPVSQVCIHHSPHLRWGRGRGRGRGRGGGGDGAPAAAEPGGEMLMTLAVSVLVNIAALACQLRLLSRQFLAG